MGTIIMSICLIYLSYRWRNENAVRMTSWKLNIISICGLDIVVLCFVFQVMDEEDWSEDSLETFCFTRSFLFLTGVSVFIGTIFSKIYRVHKIFNSRRYSERKNPVQDSQIMKFVVMYLALNLTFITIFQLLFPYKRVIKRGTINQIDIVTYQQTVWGSCEMEHEELWQLTVLIANGGVLILGANWAWETRGVRYAALNDSVQVGYILMLIILLVSFNLICTSLLDDPNFNFFISFVSMLLVTWFTIGVLFLHKYWSMFSGEVEEEDSSDYDNGITSDRRCSHCNMPLRQSSYNIEHDYCENTGGNTAAVELSKPE